MPSEEEFAGGDRFAEGKDPKAAGGDEELIYQGTALRLEESYEIANAVRPQFILLMGDKDVGKTTFLAELHHLYLQGPFAGHLFAGSRTLLGFEERCFLSRLRSGLDEEDTERTKSRHIRLLHLCLAREATPARKTDLLFGDVSGERYRDIKTSVEEARELAPIVRRADHVVFLVDGDRLSKPKTKMLTRSNANLLLRGLLEEGGLSGHSSIHVVFSKWDCVAAQKAEDEATQLESTLRKTGEALSPKFHRIAARVANPTDELSSGYGVATLLTGLLSSPRREMRSVLPLTLLPPSREFLRYRFVPRAS